MKIGYCFTGSFCTLERSLGVLCELVGCGYDVLPIMSENAYYTDTRFQRAEEFSRRVESVCGRKIIHTVVDAEPLGPASPLDLLVVAPCTGNTLAKIANGITDSSVTMAVKAHLRNNRPVVFAIATNDALGGSAVNIGKLLNTKNIYFVPFGQDDPIGKNNSLIADFDKTLETIFAAINGEQLQPILIK